MFARMLHGHYWTLRAHLLGRLNRERRPDSRDWYCDVEDPRLGAVRLSGRWREVPESDTVVVIVHGLGGSSESVYVGRAEAAAARAGIASLCVNLRGADLRGEDLFHAGLSSDLHVVTSSPELARYRHVVLLGYSLGGHVCLCHAATAMDPRVRAVAALCSPLDLAAAARAFDAPRLSVYRRHVLDGLKAMYRAFHARRPDVAQADLRDVLAIDRIRTWDERVVVPRHGFRSAEHYYSEASAGPQLASITAPTLLLHARHDPMVPSDTVRPWTLQVNSLVTVVESPRGGHVGFPPEFSLGWGNEPQGLEAQVLGWLLASERLARFTVEPAVPSPFASASSAVHEISE